MLRQISFTKKDEQELAFAGSQRTYPYYVVGIPFEFANKYKCKVNVYVDNVYFTKELKKAFNSNRKISVVNEKITEEFFFDLLRTQPLICHIDDNALGDYFHVSHFIILEKSTEKYVYIIDPWNGKRSKVSFLKLMTAIRDLKNQVKMCPLLFSIE